jgi:hypothetical protein
MRIRGYPTAEIEYKSTRTGTKLEHGPPIHLNAQHIVLGTGEPRSTRQHCWSPPPAAATFWAIQTRLCSTMSYADFNNVNPRPAPAYDYNYRDYDNKASSSSIPLSASASKQPLFYTEEPIIGTEWDHGEARAEHYEKTTAVKHSVWSGWRKTRQGLNRGVTQAGQGVSKSWGKRSHWCLGTIFGTIVASVSFLPPLSHTMMTLTSSNFRIESPSLSSSSFHEPPLSTWFNPGPQPIHPPTSQPPPPTFPSPRI